MANFDKAVFDAAFKKQVNAIAKSEKVTREAMRELSRSILEATHATGDIGYVNKLLTVLTPVNKKVCVLYAKQFTGFQYDDDHHVFTKKSKKNYDAAATATAEFLADPNNNIWSWAERNVTIDPKPLDLSKITTFIKGVLKKADSEGIAQSEVVKAIFAAGMDVDALIEVLSTMDDVKVTVNEE